MSIFKRKQKIKLSPKLARTIGQSQNSFFTASNFLLLLALIIVGAWTINNYHEPKINSSVTSAHSENTNEILGVTTPNIIEYQVKKGDSLVDISKKYGVYWLTIVSENELSPPYNLTPGEILRIPTK